VSNSNATFSVNASGTIQGYQWYRNGVKIDGATASTYTFSTLSFNDNEKYKVEITGPCGALMSNEVNLQVKPSLPQPFLLINLMVSVLANNLPYLLQVKKVVLFIGLLIILK
jgi:hypothetical protein